MPGFLRIMPGISIRIIQKGQSSDHASVGELVRCNSRKKNLLLRSMEGLHRKLWYETVLPLKPFGRNFFSLTIWRILSACSSVMTGYPRAFSCMSWANSSAFLRSSALGRPLFSPPKYFRKLFVFHPAQPNSPEIVYPFAFNFSRSCE